MFGGNKPTGFGTSFGSNTATFGSTPFGATSSASNNLFGNTSFTAQTPASTGGLFGATQPQTAGGLFGQQNQNQANTFGASSGFTFGTTPSTSGGLFGQTNTTSASGGLFSTPSNNAFGAKTPGFTGFGSTAATTTTASTGLFGGQSSTTNLFGSTPAANAGVFGNTAAAQSGTIVKFNPPAGQDSMMKNGQSQQIQTKHQCITAMKEYENKSLEELRVEDYVANRKGKQAAAAGGLFGTPAASASTSTGFSFGPGAQQPQQSTTGFGTGLFGTQTTASNTGIFGQQQQPAAQSTGLFGNQNKSLFGTPTTTTQQTGFGFGTTPAANTGTSLFGPNQNKPLFGTATTQPSTGLFGAPAASSASTFGAGGFGFGTNTSSAAGGLFGNQARPAGFGAATTTTPAGFSFGQNTNTGLFGGARPFGATTQAPAFGAPSTATLFNKPAAFGTPGFGGFGTSTSTAAPAANIFGNAASKPGGFGFAVGGTNTGMFAGTTAFNPGAAPNMAQTNTVASTGQNNAQLQHLMMNLKQAPYGDSPLYWNLRESKTKPEDVLKPTNPAAQKTILQNSSNYKVHTRPVSKIKPKALHSLTNGGKSQLFDGLGEDDFSMGSDIFQPRKSVKKLVLKKRNLDASSDLTNQTLEITDILSASRDDTANRTGSSEDPIFTQRNRVHSPPSAHTTPKELVDSENIIRSKLPDPQIPDLSNNKLQENLDDTIAALNAKNKKAFQANSTLDSSLFNSSQEDSIIIRDTTPPPHPANIVLTRPGYYTIPSFEKLAMMVDDNGNCVVDDFTIGREGYGSVFFPGATNVANMNMDDIVFFRRKEIIVYPEDDFKPPLGEGLNKPAEVTLDCVWPNDKSTRTPIKDAERLIAMNYPQKIEEITAKIGAKFIEYRLETGSWVFEVKHFSKYGILEDNDETDVSEQEKKRLKLAQEKQLGVQKQKVQVQQDGKVPTSSTNAAASTTPAAQNIVQDDTDEESMIDDDSYIPAIQQQVDGDMAESPEKFDGDVEVEPSSYRIAQNLGVHAHRMQVMKASFFDDTESHEPQNAPVAMKKPQTPTPSIRRETGLGQSLFTSSLKSKIASPVKLTQKPQIDTMNESQSFFSPRLVAPDPVRPHQIRTFLPSPEYPIIPSGLSAQDVPQKIVGTKIQRINPGVNESLVYRKQQALIDAACFMGRRFRVGWGPGWTLVHSGTPIHKSQEVSVGHNPFPALTSGGSTMYEKRLSRWTVSVEQLNVSEYFHNRDRNLLKNHEELLSIQLDHSDKQREDGCPLFTPASGNKCIHQYTEQAEITDQYPEHPESSRQKHMETVWKLCAALWGDLPELHKSDFDGSNYLICQARREAFSQWLSSTAALKINEEVQSSKYHGNSYLSALISLLTGRQIAAACKLAHSSGDHRLALLIAQSEGGHMSRQLLDKQLNDWTNLNASQFVNSQRLKVYSLLSGNLVLPSPVNSVNVCDELDWKRALAFHLWFQCKPNAVIADALCDYENGFKGRTEFGKYCVPPLPPYMENKENILLELAELGGSDKDYHVTRDTCYHLLKLYCQKSHRMERILQPTTSTPDHLDFRLSWHLLQILQALGYKHLSDYQEAYIHTSLASQLESIGLWHWAVFVVLHIEDKTRRTHAVKELLNQHISLSKDPDYLEKEEFVQEKLMVPLEWIHSAKALRSRYEKKYHEQAWHRIIAGQWNESHTIIMRHIASEAIVNDEFEYLKKFLIELCPEDRRTMITDWKTGGQLFLDYINMCENVEALTKEEPRPHQLESLMSDLISLCNRLKSFTCLTPIDRLCQSEMAKRSSNILRSVFQNIPQLSSHPSSCFLAPHISNLPMPEDYHLQELQALTRSYTTEMVR